MVSPAFWLNQFICDLQVIYGWNSLTFYQQVCHFLPRWYLDFDSIMEKTCSTISTSPRHSSTTSTLFEHGQMLIWDEQHQIFGVCNQICMHSHWSRQSKNTQRLAHFSKHSWTKEFSWFGRFLSMIHTRLQSHSMAFESVH